MGNFMAYKLHTCFFFFNQARQNGRDSVQKVYHTQGQSCPFSKVPTQCEGQQGKEEMLWSGEPTYPSATHVPGTTGTWLPMSWFSLDVPGDSVQSSGRGHTCPAVEARLSA